MASADMNMGRPESTSLFTPDELVELDNYYGGAIKGHAQVVELLQTLTPPETAPVALVNYYISKAIVYYYKGWFPHTDITTNNDVRDRVIADICRTQFAIDDKGRLDRILQMSNCYVLHYDGTIQPASIVMTAQVGNGYGEISIKIPPVTPQIVASSYKTKDVSVAGADRPRGVTVIGSIFKGRGKLGDFNWMIKQPEYQESLFIFNDHEEASNSYLKNWISGNDITRQNELQGEGCLAGGGNAVIRPYRCNIQDPWYPRSAGLPTGRYIRGRGGHGYTTVAEAEAGAQNAMTFITSLVNTGRYRQVYYSAGADGLLGHSIFQIAPEVRKYFTNFLLSLARPN